MSFANISFCATGVAKDSDASLSNRATAAKDAMGDKMDETSHNVCPHVFHVPAVRWLTSLLPQSKAGVNKEAAKH